MTSAAIMSILTDRQIKERVARDKMIEPFTDHLVRDWESRRILSFGLSSSGYDARLAREGRLLNATIPSLNCKAPQERQFDIMSPIHCEWGWYFELPPHGCMLGRSEEYFRIPDDIMVIATGKSTYARSFVHILTTPMEPGWEGHLTIEIANLSEVSQPIYINEGIFQAIFFQLSEVPETTYAKRGGKYQGQRGVTLGRV